MPLHSFPSRASRGSVLLVALILAAIIGVSLVSYMNLANNSLKQAARSFYANSAMNIAEIGIERAIASFNELDNSTSAVAWSGWSTNTTPYHATSSPSTPWAKRTFSLSSLGPGAVGSINVYAQHYEGSTTQSPKIVARAVVTQAGGPQIEKYIEVTLRRRSLFANGLVAKDDIIWAGSPKAASWNSDPTGTGSPIYAYDPSRMTAEITLGSLRGDIGLSGGEVWGYAKTGPDGSITGGSVHDLGTTEDDPTRRTNDFNATFPPVVTPTASVYNFINSTVNSSLTLPRPTDTGVSTQVNDIPGTYYFYKVASGAAITLTGNDAMVIDGNVVLIYEGHTNTMCFSTSGNGSMTINTGATLNVYTNGNVNIAGNGLVNDNPQPKNCFFWGTRTTDGQTFSISGNGQLKAVVYAPNANVDLNGGGTNGMMMGSVVARQIKMNGGTQFYYDESLANFTRGNPYGLSKWKELQSAPEREPYVSLLTF